MSQPDLIAVSLAASDPAPASTGSATASPAAASPAITADRSRMAARAGAPSSRLFDREGLFGRVWPFALVATFATAVDSLDARLHDPGPATAGMVLLGVAMVVAFFVPWTRLPRHADLIPLLACILGLVLLRHSALGHESGAVVLLLLPVVWVALYGNGQQLAIVLAAALAALALPVLVIGGEIYPAEDWQRVAVFGPIGALVGLTVHRLVTRERLHIAVEAQKSATLAEKEARLRAIHESANDAIVTLSPDGRIVDVNPAALEMFRATTADQLVGQDLIASRAIEAEREFLRGGMARLTVEQDATVSRRFKTELIRLDGDVFPAEVSVGVVVVEGSYLVHAFARDISERERSEARARQHQGDLAGLLEVARQMSASASGTEVRTLICETALRLASAAMAIFVEPVGDELVTTAAAGRASTIRRVPRDGRTTLTATAFHHGDPIFSGRLRDDPRVARLAASAGVSSGFWQPIRAAAGVAGVLVVLWDDSIPSLDPRTESLLNLLASQAAVALELGQLVGTLENLARTDGLTGIANRRTFDETLAAEVARAARSGGPLSLILLDLDHFKRFNDAHGHQAGDRLLIDVAAAWMRELRPSDSLARYGGEEFVVVLPDCSTDAALRVAARLRRDVPGQETVSAGVATLHADETADELLARADAALYRAKAEGRDRVVAA